MQGDVELGQEGRPTADFGVISVHNLEMVSILNLCSGRVES